MNILHEAYATLGLKPGSSKDLVQSRWKRLSMVWHPDRLPSEDGKREAETELKKINNAKDILWKHFESGAHRVSGCECQPGSEDQPEEPTPRPGPKRTRTPDPEEEARRRDAERQRRAAEEANSQRQQEQEQQRELAKESANQAAQKQAKEDDLRWKIAKAEAIVFVCLCVFGSIGSAINAGLHDLKTKQELEANDKIVAKTRIKDPCQSGTSATPPSFAQANIKDAAMQATKLWRTNCKGNSEGAIVTGENERGQLTVGLNYGPNFTYRGQWLVRYDSVDKVIIEFWNPPNRLDGRTIYNYDSSHNLTEISRVDAQSQPILIATIERRPDGQFFAVNFQYILENRTSRVYQTDDPQLAKNFLLCNMFGKIANQINPAPTVTSPDVTPTYAPTGDLSAQFKNRDNPFTAPYSTPSSLTPLNSLPSTSTTTDTALPQTSTSTSTDQHLFQSPFRRSATTPSVTPETNALMKKLNQQNK